MALIMLIGGGFVGTLAALATLLMGFGTVTALTVYFGTALTCVVVALAATTVIGLARIRFRTAIALSVSE